MLCRQLDRIRNHEVDREEFYMEHDDVRQQIAQAGLEKVFTFEDGLKEVLLR